MECLDELKARFEREMERTKPLDRIYAAISTLVLGLIAGFYIAIPVTKDLLVYSRGFDWKWLHHRVYWRLRPISDIYKGIRAWRERRTWIG